MYSTSQPHYPNRFARQFFLATREIIGSHGLGAVLTLAGLSQYVYSLPPDDLERAFPFAHIAALNRSLEEMYGIRGGRGMAQRIGRAWLEQGMTGFGALVGVGDPAFKALPQSERGQLGLLALADVFTRFSDQRTRVEAGPEQARFVVGASPMAYGRVSDRPVCTALVGLLQELMQWTTGGEYPIHEVACQASGEMECVFVVGKRPQDS